MTSLVAHWLSIDVTAQGKKTSYVNKYFLANRYLGFLGTISYETYLFHLPVRLLSCPNH